MLKYFIFKVDKRDFCEIVIFSREENLGGDFKVFEFKENFFCCLIFFKVILLIRKK